MTDLDAIVVDARAAFEAAAMPADLENAKALFLGKTGRITELMKGMAQLSVDEKKSRGAAINVAKQAIEAALNARRQALADAELEKQLKSEALDVSLPAASALKADCIRCLSRWSGLRRYLARWVLTLPKDRRLKPIGLISRRSTRLKTTRRAQCTTPFMSTAAKK